MQANGVVLNARNRIPGISIPVGAVVLLKVKAIKEFRLAQL